MCNYFFKVLLLGLCLMMATSPIFAQHAHSESEHPVAEQGSSLYYIQLGVFSDNLNAHSLAAWIEGKQIKYPVLVLRGSGKYAGQYLVVIDGLQTIPSAKAVIRKLGMEGIIRRR